MLTAAQALISERGKPPMIPVLLVLSRQLPVGKVSSLSHPYSLHMKGYQVVLLVFALKLPGINTTCYTYHDIGKLKNKYIHIYIYFFLNHNTQVHACNYSTKKEHLCCKTNPDINWSTEVMSFSNTHTKKKKKRHIGCLKAYGGGSI